MSALTAAIKTGNAALVRGVFSRDPSLRSRIDEPLPDSSFDMPAIVVAASRGNRDIVDVLLEEGANVNQRTLWWAGGFGVLDLSNPELSEYLISRGATIDIHSAARLGKVELVREFLAGNSSLVHARGGDGQLPLHFAATVEIAALRSTWLRYTHTGSTSPASWSHEVRKRTSSWRRRSETSRWWSAF